MKNKKGILFAGISTIVGVSQLMQVSAVSINEATKIDRRVLPIPNVEPAGSSILDVRNAPKQSIKEITPPKDAPNVVVIMLDDFGFGNSEVFGGPIHMPTAKKLAESGLTYNQFNTCAISASTRAALLTGYNPHTVNMGNITEFATSTAGQTSVRPNYTASVANILRYNGYATGMFGKSHEVPVWQLSDAGPSYLHPLRNGFDKFYGFIGGNTNQYSPATIYDGFAKVDMGKDPNYQLTTDMSNKAIEWMRNINTFGNGKPFFMYFAPAATHDPHQVSEEWIEKYKGKFDSGWDKYREETYKRQLEMGIIPQGTKLTPKPAAFKDWDTLSADEKKLFAHQMEVYAGYAEYADYEIGRVVQAIEDLGQLDNTLIYYTLGDNGASTEGGVNGAVNVFHFYNSQPESVEYGLEHYDDLGTDKSYSNYAAAWGVAGNTPFATAKIVASDFGGTRNGLIVHWPKYIDKKQNGTIRSQFHHVIDVVPTILEAAKLPQPSYVDGVKQKGIQGHSMLYSFNNPKAASTNTTQYFEIMGNRAIYHNGWYARVIHKVGWEPKPRTTLDKDVWELYDITKDFSLADNLASKYPEKLKEMIALFDKQAIENHVYPLDDRFLERFDAEVAGRVNNVEGLNSITLYPGMDRIPTESLFSMINMSFTITSEINVQEKVNGAILAFHGRFGGISLYTKDGYLYYAYNNEGLKIDKLKSNIPLTQGKHIVKLEFMYDGGGNGKGGLNTMYIDNKQVGQMRIDETVSLFFSYETNDVGKDLGTPVVDDYQSPFDFQGEIKYVKIDANIPVNNK